MKRTIRAAIVLASLGLCTGAGATVVTIEVPGAQNVWPLSINDKGQVAGFYFDAFGQHGFLWQRGGTLATFDVSGAQDTRPVAISPTGVITGFYDNQRYYGGFMRASDGTITTFKVLHGRSTEVFGANSQGWSVGGYGRSKQSVLRPFLRGPSGVTTEFSVPGATGDAIAVLVNRSLTVAGSVVIQSVANSQGFVRSADGTITVFGDLNFHVAVAGINDAGTIVGAFQGGGQSEAFVRTSDGTLTTFLAPNGSKGTLAYAINNSGTIAGDCYDSNRKEHGFLRAADGTFTPFDFPGSLASGIWAINNKGAIAGIYKSKDGLNLGFAGAP